MEELKALSAAALLAAILVPATARASAPAGVWVKVQEIVYAPDATSPTHVQIHGALMLYDGNLEAPRPYVGYTSPALGYMYYRCPDGQAEVCRQEWRDLAANIAKPDAECLGFGDMMLPTGTLRQPGEAAQNPDAYPIQSGVSPGFSPCQAIAKYLAEEATGGAGGAASSGGASSGGASSTPGGAPASMSGASASPVSGSSGGPPGGSGSTTTAGRPGSSGTSQLAPEKPAEGATAESRAAGCSITNATGAASLLGLGAAVGAFALALARRHRSRK